MDRYPSLGPLQLLFGHSVAVLRLSAGTLPLRGVGVRDAGTDRGSGKHTAPAASGRSGRAESHIRCSAIELWGGSLRKRERD